MGRTERSTSRRCAANVCRREPTVRLVKDGTYGPIRLALCEGHARSYKALGYRKES